MKTSDIYVDWALGKISGVLLMGGMLDDSTGLHTLQRLISEFDGYGRRITLSAVDIETGDYVEFDQKNMDFYDTPYGAISSASIPFVFPPHHWKGRGTFMDGGTVYNLNVEAAVR